MNVKNQLVVTLTAALIIGGVITSCKKKKNDETPEPSPTVPNKNIGYSLAISGGTYPNETTYFLGSEGFPTGTVNTGSAAELASSGSLFSYGGFSYVTTFGAPATLYKYGFDENGTPKQVGAFAVPGLKTFGAIDFVSSTEAYAASNGYGGVPTLIRFNPTNMLITGSINLTSIQKAGATNVFYLGLVHRDSMLYMGVNYQNGFSNLADSTFVAVINRNTQSVKKIIADGRTGMIWSGGSKDSFTPQGLVLGENNDIYVTGTGNGASVPSGVLKIANGQTNFDASYFFDLKAAAGADCLGLFYYGNGKAFTCKTTSPADYPFDPSSGPGFRYHKIDLIAKTSQGDLSSALPDVFSYAFIANWDANKVYFNVPAASSNAIYSFDRSGGSVTQAFTSSSGTFVGFAKLN